MGFLWKKLMILGLGMGMGMGMGVGVGMTSEINLKNWRLEDGRK